MALWAVGRGMGAAAVSAALGEEGCRQDGSRFVGCCGGLG